MPVRTLNKTQTAAIHLTADGSHNIVQKDWSEKAGEARGLAMEQVRVGGVHGNTTELLRCKSSGLTE